MADAMSSLGSPVPTASTAAAPLPLSADEPPPTVARRLHWSRRHTGTVACATTGGGCSDGAGGAGTVRCTCDCVLCACNCVLSCATDASVVVDADTLANGNGECPRGDATGGRLPLPNTGEREGASDTGVGVDTLLRSAQERGRKAGFGWWGVKVRPFFGRPVESVPGFTSITKAPSDFCRRSASSSSSCRASVASRSRSSCDLEMVSSALALAPGWSASASRTRRGCPASASPVWPASLALFTPVALRSCKSSSLSCKNSVSAPSRQR
eukprot:scaffold49376_cov32-Tisochrysis_lutea.AAC.6